MRIFHTIYNIIMLACLLCLLLNENVVFMLTFFGDDFRQTPFKPLNG